MNAGLESATGLSSVTDVIAFRAAMDVEREERRERGENYENLSWIYGMKRLERGLDANLFGRIMELTRTAEGGSMEGVITRMTGTFGLNHIQAYELYRGVREGRHMDDGELRRLIDRQRDPPSVTGREFQAAQITARVVNLYTEMGMYYFDRQFNVLAETLDQSVTKYGELKRGSREAERRERWEAEDGGRNAFNLPEPVPVPAPPSRRERGIFPYHPNDAFPGGVPSINAGGGDPRSVWAVLDDAITTGIRIFRDTGNDDLRQTAFDIRQSFTPEGGRATSVHQNLTNFLSDAPEYRVEQLYQSLQTLIALTRTQVDLTRQYGNPSITIIDQ